MPLTNAMLIKNKAIIGGGSSGGSSGGGHAIQDSSGTVMSQQPTLQFTGDVEVADESTNNKTVVNIPKARTITWDEWQELPDEEKEQGKWDITDVPGADGKINAELLTKLWENPNPTANFPAQEITLSSDDYDFLLVIGHYTVGVGYTVEKVVPKGETFQLETSYVNSAGVYTFNRDFRFQSDTLFEIKNAYVQLSLNKSYTEDNSRLVPIAIYGLKTTIDLKINAIASDVSTSASKCMMSDGTSVEEKLSGVSLPAAPKMITNRSVLFSILQTANTNRFTDMCEMPYDGFIQFLMAIQGSKSEASAWICGSDETSPSEVYNGNRCLVLASLTDELASVRTTTATGIWLPKGTKFFGVAKGSGSTSASIQAIIADYTY